MITTAILYEDDKPIRLFRDERCIYSAYRWTHRHFCLDEQGFMVHQLPNYLKVKFFLLTEEQIKEIIK